MRRILKNKNAMLLWVSRTISRFGDSMESLALMYLVYDLTGSGLAMSTVMICSMLPNLVVSPFAGAIVDSFNKKKILFISELIRTIAILVIPLSMWLGVIKLWYIYIIAIIVSIAESFFEPCYGVTVALTVPKEDLPIQNSIVTLSNNIARCVGYSLAGFIMIKIGKDILFLFDSFTFLLSAIFALFLKFQDVYEKKSNSVKGMFSNIGGGLKYLVSNRIIIGFILVFLTMSILIGPMSEFIPFTLEGLFALNETWSGILLTLFSIGTVLGSIVYPIIYKRKVKFNKLVFISYVVLGGITGLCLIIPNTITAIIMYFIFGLLVSVLNMWVSTGIQQRCDISYMGRVSSIISIVITASSPLACALYGVIIDFFGIIVVYYCVAIIFIALAIILSIYTDERKIKIEA